MGRLTIRLSDERQQALKETAAMRGRTIGQLIEESLDAYGVKTRAQASTIVAQARRQADLGEDEAIKLATNETRDARGNDS